MLFDNRILKRWSDVLLLVQRIMMMAEPNAIIGVSPAKLLERHNVYSNSRMLDIWKQPQVLLHALTSAPMS